MKQTEKKALSVEEVIKQSEISAKEVIRQLQESLDHEFITFPELIRILESSLEKAKIEIKVFRPGNLFNFSLNSKRGWLRNR